MTDMYDLMDADRRQGREEPFDKEAWADRKRQERERVFALADEAALKVNADPAERRSYAAALGALPGHSATNVLLAHAQRPGLTRIGDARYWAQKGASIKKGEKGIAILEPGREYVRDDGSVGSFFDVRKVFDASQTTARPRLERRNSLGDVLTALVMNAPCAIEPADGEVPGGARYDPAVDAIAVQRGLTERELFDGLSVECAHAALAREGEYGREAAHPLAALAAAATARRFGLEPPGAELPAPAAPDADARTVREALNGARAAAADLGGRIADALARDRRREEPVR